MATKEDEKAALEAAQVPKPSKLAPKFNISACPWTPGMAFIPVLYTAARKAALLAQAEAVKASFCDLLLVIDNIGSGIDCSSQVTDWRFTCADSVSKCLTHYYLELDWHMGRKASTLPLHDPIKPAPAAGLHCAEVMSEE